MTKEQLPTSLKLEAKLEALTGLHVKGSKASDDVRVTIYHIGGDGVVHQDAYKPPPPAPPTVMFADRLGTVIIYVGTFSKVF